MQPLPYSKAEVENGEQVQEKLLPLGGPNLGVVSAGFRDVDGGYQLVVRVIPTCDREAIERIVNEYALGRDVQIEETTEYPSRH